MYKTTDPYRDKLIADLQAENTELKKQIAEQANALIELAEIIEGGKTYG